MRRQHRRDADATFLAMRVVRLDAGRRGGEAGGGGWCGEIGGVWEVGGSDITNGGGFQAFCTQSMGMAARVRRRDARIAAWC